MKKTISILLLTFIFGLFVSPNLKDSQCSAQVRFYVSKARYDKNGVKHEANYSTYFTTINNGDVIYESDKNGNAKYSSIIYKYVATKDGLLVYQMFNPLLVNNMFASPWSPSFLYFTPDYKRLNQFQHMMGDTFVYDLSQPGDEIKTPTTFY